MRLENLLERSALAHPDKTALIVGDQRLDYAALDAQANRFAHAAAGRGLVRGGRVLIFLDNSVESVVALFGTLKAGGIFSLVSSLTKPEKLAFILGNLEPHIVVTQQRLLPVVDEAIAAGCLVGTIWVTDGSSAGTHIALASALAAERDDTPAPGGIDLDLAYVLYTSGSTGVAKGVMMTHQSAVAGASSMVSYLGSRHDDIILSVVPVSFDYGMYQVIMSCLCGGTLILEASFAFPNVVLRKANSERATILPVVPTTASIIANLKKIVPGAFPTIRTITSTAASLPPAISLRLQEIFPTARIFSNYGLTENIRGAFLPPEQLALRPTSVGKAMPNTEAFIVDENGARVGPGVMGRLMIRGSCLMKGYWRNPTATEEMLKPGPHAWEKVLDTGDLFRSDDEGYLYYIGRSDDLLKTRGEKVPPKDVEDCLYRLAGVREAAIVGVPDPVQGMAIRAILALEPGIQLELRDVQAHCIRFLEDFMVPSSVEFRTELPKSESGKILRRALQNEVLRTGAGSL